MNRKLITILVWVLFANVIGFAADSEKDFNPETYIAEQEQLFHDRIRNANKKLETIQKNRKVKVKAAVKTYIKAIKRIKKYWSSKGKLEKVLEYQKLLEKIPKVTQDEDNSEEKLAPQLEPTDEELDKSPKAYLIRQKMLSKSKIKKANTELMIGKKRRIKEVESAIDDYDAAMQKVKEYWTKINNLEKAVKYKKIQEEFRMMSLENIININKKTVDVDESELESTPNIDTNLTPPDPVVDNTIEEDPISFDSKEETNKPEITESNNNTEVENKPEIESNAIVDNINLDLEEVCKSLSYNEKSLKDYGFSVNGSCIAGPLLEGDEHLFISKTTYKFNGKCEYCFKIKGRWYHGGVLKIDDKIYYMSFGHWANNGARIITNGHLENTNKGAKITVTGQEETKLKGKEYKVDRYSKDWNEVKIVIDNGNVSYSYNGKEIYKETVDIPKGEQLQFGFSTYRCETELKDFSLKLK